MSFGEALAVTTDFSCVTQGDMALYGLSFTELYTVSR